jgi:predicted DNA-binding transcriptional regulator AlpA
MVITTQTEYLTESGVASLSGLSIATLRKWRLLGKGPRFRKLGRAVRYSTTDLGEWLETRPTGGEGRAV